MEKCKSTKIRNDCGFILGSSHKIFLKAVEIISEFKGQDTPFKCSPTRDLHQISSREKSVRKTNLKLKPYYFLNWNSTKLSLIKRPKHFSWEKQNCHLNITRTNLQRYIQKTNNWIHKISYKKNWPKCFVQMNEDWWDGKWKWATSVRAQHK